MMTRATRPRNRTPRRSGRSSCLLATTAGGRRRAIGGQHGSAAAPSQPGSGADSYRRCAVAARRGRRRAPGARRTAGRRPRRAVRTQAGAASADEPGVLRRHVARRGGTGAPQVESGGAGRGGAARAPGMYPGPRVQYAGCGCVVGSAVVSLGSGSKPPGRRGGPEWWRLGRWRSLAVRPQVTAAPAPWSEALANGLLAVPWMEPVSWVPSTVLAVQMISRSFRPLSQVCWVGVIGNAVSRGRLVVDPDVVLEQGSDAVLARGLDRGVAGYGASSAPSMSNLASTQVVGLVAGDPPPPPGDVAVRRLVEAVPTSKLEHADVAALGDVARLRHGSKLSCWHGASEPQALVRAGMRNAAPNGRVHLRMTLITCAGRAAAGFQRPSSPGTFSRRRRRQPARRR